MKTVKVGLSPSKKMFYLRQWKTFTNDEKCFLFMLKVFFFLKISKFLSWLFGDVEKNGLIRKIRLISKFMML